MSGLNQLNKKEDTTLNGNEVISSEGDIDKSIMKATSNDSIEKELLNEGNASSYKLYKMRYFGLISLIILNIVCALR